jgi:hypothetical protein
MLLNFLLKFGKLKINCKCLLQNIFDYFKKNTDFYNFITVLGKNKLKRLPSPKNQITVGSNFKK